MSDLPSEPLFGLPETVTLTLVGTGEPVIARLVELDRRLAREMIDKRWWYEPWITHEARRWFRANKRDYYWSWASLVGEVRNQWWVEKVALQTPDGEIQGAIILDPTGQSILDPDEGTLYVKYVVAAPRNRAEFERFSGRALYKGTGCALLYSAMQMSLKRSLGGRLTLQPLNDVVGWYVNRHGFVDTGHPSDGDTNYLELRPEPAQAAIEEALNMGVL
jgi:hypothetical protein